MVLHILRALFILLLAAAGYYGIQQVDPLSLPVWLREWTWLTLMVTITLGVLIVCVDMLAPRRKLSILSGTFLGLMVGMMAAYALSFVIALLVEQFGSAGTDVEQRRKLIQFFNVVVGTSTC